MEIVNTGLTAGAFPQVPGEEGYMPGRPPFDNCRFCEYHRVCPIGRDQEICRTVDPELRSIEVDHATACHFPQAALDGP